ncbi:hypothetical protein [Reichenbachiella ulvae]|uniref:SMODS-associated NUDIX domain-containing protein n=1 Tax=Reichenbachiella ulvae TaxID=2980104 RepID=A0ABT3CPB2_9BACT|nr:hypothetical protein [Reichenbachiella ulvae]MCV9385565.1 hypothetical protein [Reichenbachiella ulvae]
METFSLTIEVLVVGLLLAGLMTIVKYPKDVVRGFFNLFRPEATSIRSWIFFPIWMVGRLIEVTSKFEIYDHEEGENFSEEPYKSNKNLKFDFASGTKYLVTNIDSAETLKVIKEFIGYSSSNIIFEDFSVESKFPAVVKCPDEIRFYDFNLLIQFLSNENKSSYCYGLFKSEELSYYSYQDSATTHNIIGKTNSGQKFSIYTLDDLNKKVHLRLNQSIQINEMKVELQEI